MTTEEFDNVVSEITAIAEKADRLVQEFVSNGAIPAAIANAKNLAAADWKLVREFESRRSEFTRPLITN